MSKQTDAGVKDLSKGASAVAEKTEPPKPGESVKEKTQVPETLEQKIDRLDKDIRAFLADFKTFKLNFQQYMMRLK